MKTIIGVFYDRDDAEAAIEEIRNQGFTEEEMSIIAKEGAVQKEDEEEEEGLGQDLTTGITTGGVIGGLTGLLAGAGALAIPGVGPILAVGPITAGLTGIAAGGLVGSLVDLGIPRQRSEHYQEEIRKGGILAIIEGDDEEEEVLTAVLREHGARDVESH